MRGSSIFYLRLGIEPRSFVSPFTQKLNGLSTACECQSSEREKTRTVGYHYACCLIFVLGVVSPERFYSPSMARSTKSSLLPTTNGILLFSDS